MSSSDIQILPKYFLFFLHKYFFTQFFVTLYIFLLYVVIKYTMFSYLIERKIPLCDLWFSVETLRTTNNFNCFEILHYISFFG